MYHIYRAKKEETVHVTSQKQTMTALETNKGSHIFYLERKQGNFWGALERFFWKLSMGKLHGQFEGEISLNVSPDAKPVQLPTCAAS